MDKSQVEQIVGQLTNEEKIVLLGGNQPVLPEMDGELHGIERVGLKPLKLADGPVGVHWWTKAATAYPASITLAASFDEGAAYRVGEAIGTDCRAVGVHVLLAPGVNLYRSPLCGRNFEYFGEDPELSGCIAAAYIRGVQSCGVAATVKHFTANNQEYDRHRISSDVDERTLREVYMRPFEIAVKEAQPGCLMTSYNLLNGQHASECEWLINEVLREEWGFDGFVMSDWYSVYSTAQTMNSGLDLEMPVGLFMTQEKVEPLLEAGIVSQKTLDDKVRHRLRLMQRFGWLDADHEQLDKTLPVRNFETESVALDAVRMGSVLVENKEDFLPVLPGRVKRITVLGHHAVCPVTSGGGSAYTPPHEAVTLAEAIGRGYGDAAEVSAYEMIDLMRAPKTWEQTVFCDPGLTAEYFADTEVAGEPVATELVDKISCAWEHGDNPVPGLGSLYSIRWSGQLDVPEAEEYYVYTWFCNAEPDLYINGKRISLKETAEPVSVLLEAGRHDFSLTIKKQRPETVRCFVGMEPASRSVVDYEAGLRAAADSDLVVVAAGFVRYTEAENVDRSFALEDRVNQMVLDAVKANPNTVVVLYSGGAVDVAPWINQVKSLLCIWYPGQNGTIAAAEILAGQTNPSGKLPFTWEDRTEDRGSYSCYHDDDGDGRVAYLDGVFTGYRHFDHHQINPRYAFGHGLSYTTFLYENFVVSPMVDDCKGVSVQFDLINTGVVAGAEAALIFVSDDEASLLRPAKELKAVKKVCLESGERQTITVTLPLRAFSFWHSDSKRWTAESGSFVVSAGSSAEKIFLSARTELIETKEFD